MAHLANAIPVRNPRTGATDHHITPPTEDELAAIFARLRGAQPAWREAGVEARAAVLRRWADAILAEAPAISAAEEADTGRRRVAREVPHMVAGALRGWSGKAPGVMAAAQLAGDSTSLPGVRYSTLLDPYAVVGMITPWNHPFLLSTMDAIPALLAGCAVVVKPSEVAPRFVEPVRRSIAAVPELAAVLEYVVGDGETGQALIARADMICFTGSVPTGRQVAEACARRFIPAFLELGGKDAVIITRNADIERAATAALRGAMHNSGQLCFSTERIYVDAAIHDPFVEALVAKAERMEPNYPDIGRGHIGPFILERQAAIVDSHLDDALAKGAVLRTGGRSRTLGGGLYMPATVVTEVTHGMRIMREETFGPVAPVMRFRDEEEAMALANDTDRGLSGSVIAGDDAEAERIAARLNAGGISLQDTALTLGILRDAEKTSYGMSGLGGSRMGPNGLLRFLRRKAIMRRDAPVLSMEQLSEHATGASH
jgi:acyl-CoA reductase-like NAD-dependent aldehyde dehydrogenase